MPTEAERIKSLMASIDRSLRLLDDFALLKDHMGDERYGAAVELLRSAQRNERCYTMPVGTELVMSTAVCVSRPDGSDRIVPMQTKLKFVGDYDKQMRLQCEALDVPAYKGSMKSPVLTKGELVWLLPDWCKVA